MMAMVIGFLIISALILAVLVKMWDLKRKRESEAVIVQSQISDALLREPALFNLAVTPTAHVPLWKGSPVTVESPAKCPPKTSATRRCVPSNVRLPVCDPMCISTRGSA